MKGYVYIISNKAMPGIFKVGYTDRDPTTRAKELASTGVPHPYIVEYEILLDNPSSVEYKTHNRLKGYRENKEWFRCEFSKCVEAIKESYSGTVYYEKCYKREKDEELFRVEVEKRKRKEKLKKEKEARRKKEEEIRKIKEYEIK